MKSSGHVSHTSRLSTGVKSVVLAFVASLMFVQMASAEHFRSGQTLSTQNNSANFTKHANEASQVSGHSESKGVGLFETGSAGQEVVMITMTGSFQGTSARLTNHGSEVLSFGDGSTIKLDLEGQSQGKQFSGKITNAQGTGRFKGIKMTGSLTESVLDPQLNYVVVEGNYELQ